MIRDATAADIPAILTMGRKFFDLAGWPEIAEWDDTSVETTLRNLIESKDGILLVIERPQGVVGMAGALLYPFYFNASHRTGQELFWWTDFDARGQEAAALFEALEDRAREGGAQSFVITNVDRLRANVLARYYRRRGYKPAENTFIKAL